MTEKLQQIVKEEVEKLPKEHQEAIASLDWVKISEELGNKYLIDESEVNDFQVEVLLVLAGLENPARFARNVEDNVGTSRAEAEKIAEDTLQKIFVPVGNSLIENIKKSGRVNAPGFEQNVNFILSGGNYSVFIEQRRLKDPGSEIDTSRETIQNNLEKTFGVKNKLVI